MRLWCGGRGLGGLAATRLLEAHFLLSVPVRWCSARKLQVSAEEEGSKLAGMVLAMDNVMTALRYSKYTHKYDISICGYISFLTCHQR